MRYIIMDSHKTLSSRRRDALVDFFCEVKGLDPEAAMEQVRFCEWYEEEKAVKWFETMALDGSEVVGYLRCLRNPDTAVEWFIGDVHVRRSHRGRGVATRLYELTIRELERFQAAERILSSVHRENRRSIGLHEKFGFADTGKPCVFPAFCFEEGETGFQKNLLLYYPVPGVEAGMERVLPIWLEYEKQTDPGIPLQEASDRFREILWEALEEHSCELRTVWCGNRLVGLTLRGNGRDLQFLLPEFSKD